MCCNKFEASLEESEFYLLLHSRKCDCEVALSIKNNEEWRESCFIFQNVSIANWSEA